MPSWTTKVSRRFGSAGAGTMKAASWKIFYLVYLPLGLLTHWRLWESADQDITNRDSDTVYKHRVFQNTMRLVQAVSLYRKMLQNQNIRDFELHSAAYLKDLAELYPHARAKPNHHMFQHLSDGIRRFGPFYSWHCFPFERLLGMTQRLLTNNILGVLSCFESPPQLTH